MKEDIEQRAEDYAKESILIDDPSYTSGLFYGYLEGMTEERERGKRFAQWMNKNKYHWSVLFKAYNNIDKVLMWSYNELFNQFLSEEKALNN